LEAVPFREGFVSLVGGAGSSGMVFSRPVEAPQWGQKAASAG